MSLSEWTVRRIAESGARHSRLLAFRGLKLRRDTPRITQADSTKNSGAFSERRTEVRASLHTARIARSLGTNSPQKTVPIFVPTLCIEGLIRASICFVQVIDKTNRYQPVTIRQHRTLVIRNQQVAGSIPAGGSNWSILYRLARRRVGFKWVQFAGVSEPLGFFFNN